MVAKLTREELKPIVDAYVAAGGNASEAGRALDLSESTARERIRQAKSRFPDLFPRAVPPKERTVEDEVTEHRRDTENRDLKRRLKSATSKIAELEDKVKDMAWSNNVSYEPAEWTLPDRAAHKSEHLPYLLTSDFHAGEVVRADETDAGYGYDVETFVQRYRKMIEVAIYLTTDHAGANWTFPGFIYARAGDLISGQLHLELLETDEITPLEAVLLVAEEEMGGIRRLLDAFDHVEVKSVGVGGNHDRDLMKPTTKNAIGHSLEMLVHNMLVREFKNDPRVTFQTSRGFDVRFPIYDMNIILTHGDRIGSRGGTGFIGPAANILKGAYKVRQEQAMLGYHIDRVDLGHFHYPFQAPGVLSNGSMPGYTEFAKQFRMQPSKPQQWLCYHHPRRGVVDYKPIILA